jgi:hypothetical protein
MFLNKVNERFSKFCLRWVPLLRCGLLLTTLLALAASIFAGSSSPNPLNSTDSTGTLSTYSTAGGIDQSNPFFQNLGTNGRSCGSCHVSR